MFWQVSITHTLCKITDWICRSATFFVTSIALVSYNLNPITLRISSVVIYIYHLLLHKLWHCTNQNVIHPWALKKQLRSLYIMHISAQTNTTIHHILVHWFSWVHDSVCGMLLTEYISEMLTTMKHMHKTIDKNISFKNHYCGTDLSRKYTKSTPYFNVRCLQPYFFKGFSPCSVSHISICTIHHSTWKALKTTIKCANSFQQSMKGISSLLPAKFCQKCPI